jgi:LysM repeat protein
MGKHRDPELDAYIEKRVKQEAQQGKSQYNSLVKRQEEIQSLLGSDRSLMELSRKKAKTPQEKKMWDEKIKATWQVQNNKEKVQKELKQIEDLKKKFTLNSVTGGAFLKPEAKKDFNAFSKSSLTVPGLPKLKVDVSATSAGRDDLEKEYFKLKSDETRKMVENAVAYDPAKFGLKVEKDKKGNVVSYNVVNKENQAKMNEALANAKTSKEKEAIKNKYKDLINYKIQDPLNGYTTRPGSNPGWSTGNALKMAAPVILDRMLGNKPGLIGNSVSSTLASVGIKATASHGGGGFFSGTPLEGIAKSVGGAISGVSKSASKILSGAAKPVSSLAQAAGKAGTAAYQGAGKVGSSLVKTVGQGAEGIVANTADLAENIAQGDIKGIGKEGLELIKSGKDIGLGLGKANVEALASGIGTVGAGLGDKNISRAATNIEREGEQGIDKYGGTALDIGANVLTGGGYGATQAALSGLSQGGVSGLLNKDTLTNLATQAIASQTGVDPNMLKAGYSATQGDLTGAALGAAGVDDNYASMLKSGLQGDIKGALINQVSGQLGIDPKLAEQIASGNLKGAALQNIGEQFGIDPKSLQKAEKLLGGNLQNNIMGLAGQQLGVGDDKMAIARNLASGDLEELEKKGRLVVSDQAGAYLPDEANQALDQMQQAAGAGRDTVRAMQESQAAKAAQAAQTYKIASGDTAAKIAKKLGVSLEELKAANPGVKDLNKIAAGAKLNIPQKIQDLSGPIPKGMVESGKMTQQQFDAQKAYQDWASRQEGYVGKEKKAAMEKLFLDRAQGKIPNDKFAVYQTQIEQGKIPKEYALTAPAAQDKGIVDKAKDFFGFGGDKKEGESKGIMGNISDFVNQNPNLVSGAANIAGGAAGYFLSDAQRKEALKDLQRAMAGYEDIRGTKLASEAKDIQRDKELAEMRKAGLQGFKQRAEMGLTPEDQAMLRQVQKQSLRQGAAQRQALTERAIQQGAQGGQQFMSALQAAGGTQQEASEAADRIAAESFKAKQQALRDLTGTSQQAMSADYEQDLARAQQMDAIQRFNKEQQLAGVTGQAGLRRNMAELALDRGQQLGNLAVAAGQAISNPIQAQQQQQREMELARVRQPQQAQPPVQQQTPPPAQKQTQPPKRQTPAKPNVASQVANVAQKVGVKPVAQAAQKVGEVIDQFQGIPFQMPKSQEEAVKTGKDIYDLFKKGK